MDTNSSFTINPGPPYLNLQKEFNRLLKNFPEYSNAFLRPPILSLKREMIATGT